MTHSPKTFTFDPMNPETLADAVSGVEVTSLAELAPDTALDPLKFTVDNSTCDRVRDLWKDDAELSGKVMLTCDKPLGHDRRGGHRMRNEAGKTTCTWTGPADND